MFPARLPLRSERIINADMPKSFSNPHPNRTNVLALLKKGSEFPDHRLHRAQIPASEHIQMIQQMIKIIDIFSVPVPAVNSPGLSVRIVKRTSESAEQLRFSGLKKALPPQLGSSQNSFCCLPLQKLFRHLKATADKHY